MIETFFDEHREIRLWKIRLKDRGEDYLIENKEKMLVLFDNIEATVKKNLLIFLVARWGAVTWICAMENISCVCIGS